MTFEQKLDYIADLATDLGLQINGIVTSTECEKISILDTSNRTTALERKQRAMKCQH